MSKTYMVRTEARGTSADLAPGLAARVGDPLWLLGRQRQFGELLGDDAGSPVSVELAAEAAQVSRFLGPGQPSGVAYDPARLPLEALTADEVRPAERWTARLRIDAGRAFLRALADTGAGAYAADYRAEYPIDPTSADRARDPAGARLIDVAAGRIPDGKAIYEALDEAVDAGNELPERPRIDSRDLDAVGAAVAAWVAWCDATVVETGETTWDDERLGHSFGLATGTGAGATVLEAEDFGGVSADWHSFDVRPNPSPSGFKALPTTTTLPTGVRFRGMPNPRWWEFEDATVDFGAVDAGPGDVARMALLEFALVYANDFFAVPLRLASGSVCRITSLVVADTFGMRLRIESASDSRPGADRWSMFTLSERAPGATSADVSDLLFLAPTAGQLITSEPVEDVLLLRDEMANLAWAVESRYEGETGAAAERIEEATRALPDQAPPDPEAALRYVLGTTVPAHWFPLVPELDGGEPRLRLASMANRGPTPDVRGRFLGTGQVDVPDVEVPREGVRLLRDYALARSSSGDTLAWARRSRRVGRGEGSSGLRFDVAEHPAEETTP